MERTGCIAELLRAPGNKTRSPTSYGMQAKPKACPGLQNSRQGTTLRKGVENSFSLDTLSVKYLRDVRLQKARSEVGGQISSSGETVIWKPSAQRQQFNKDRDDTDDKEQLSAKEDKGVKRHPRNCRYLRGK